MGIAFPYSLLTTSQFRGFRVWEHRNTVWAPGFRVQGLGVLQSEGLGLRVLQDFKFRC